MARKSPRVCLIPSWWTEEELQSRVCSDGSHAHVSRRDAEELLGVKEAEWAVDDRVVRRLKIRKNIRDMSAKVGPFLAMRVRQKKSWALAMYAQILNRTEPPGEVAPS